MDRSYLLLLSPPGAPERTARWEGRDGEDAARRYIDRHRGDTVYATRFDRPLVFAGIPVIVEPGR